MNLDDRQYGAVAATAGAAIEVAVDVTVVDLVVDVVVAHAEECRAVVVVVAADYSHDADLNMDPVASSNVGCVVVALVDAFESLVRNLHNAVDLYSTLAGQWLFVVVDDVVAALVDAGRDYYIPWMIGIPGGICKSLVRTIDMHY